MAPDKTWQALLGQQTRKWWPRNFSQKLENNFAFSNTTSEHPHIPQDCVGIDEKLFLVYLLVPSPKLNPNALANDEKFVFIKTYSAEFYQWCCHKTDLVSFHISHRSGCVRRLANSLNTDVDSSLANGDSARLQTAWMCSLARPRSVAGWKLRDERVQCHILLAKRLVNKELIPNLSEQFFKFFLLTPWPFSWRWL